MDKIKGFVKEDLPGPPLSGALSLYMKSVMKNIEDRKGKPQVKAYVGDRVWCRFENSPKGVVNPGIVRTVEIGSLDTVYTVISENLYCYDTFTNEDFGETIFLDEE